MANRKGKYKTVRMYGWECCDTGKLYTRKDNAIRGYRRHLGAVAGIAAVGTNADDDVFTTCRKARRGSKR